MEIKIDTSTLADLIVNELSDLNCGYHDESTVCIGIGDRVQIHLTVTSDERSFDDKPDSNISKIIQVTIKDDSNEPTQ